MSDEVAETIRRVLAQRAPDVLRDLEETDDPSVALGEQVEDALADEFVGQHGLQPDWEPTPWGKKVDDALGVFVSRFLLHRR